MTPSQLARVHRVREVQVRLAEADHARARDKADAERRLGERVAQLAAEVAPAVGPGTAAGLTATAHFRERLHQSALNAQARASAAAAQSDRAAERVTEAKRDRTAVEKLRARAEAAARDDARRAPDDAPAVQRDRHDPC